MITYRLGRCYAGPDGTIGQLYRSDELVCFTLEPPPDRPAVPSIPFGRYPLSWEKSPRLGVYTPRLNNVPGRSGILIHAGNTIADTEGCILVGSKWDQNKDRIFLYNSAITKAKVYNLIGYDLAGGGFAELEIFSEDESCLTSMQTPDTAVST
jgi:hypothetical protein